MGRLPFKSLETLECVVRLGSVTGAAQELGLSQSAISNSIRRFEQSLGLKLFERLGTSLVPTPEARQLANVTSVAISKLKDALPHGPTKGGPSVIRLSVPPTFSARWLAERLPALRKAMSPCKVTVSSKVELTEDADLWIRHGKRSDWEGFFAVPLVSEKKMPVAAPKLVEQRIITDADILNFSLIGIEARPQEWTEWVQKAGLRDRVIPEETFDVTLSAWDAAISGSGIALGDVDLLKDEIRRGDLLVLGKTALTSYRYYLCRRAIEDRKSVLRMWSKIQDMRPMK